jgi:hypothetical protein
MKPARIQRFMSRGGLVLLAVFAHGLALLSAGAQNIAIPATQPDLKLYTAGPVYCAVVQPDGKVIIGGEFTAVNNLPRTNLARLNPNGSLDLTWNPPAPDFQPYAMVLNGTDLYLGGEFAFVGGQLRKHLAKISTVTGALDPMWNPDTDEPVFALAIRGTSLYLGGEKISVVNGQPRSRLARVSLSGSGALDPLWNPAPDGRVNSLLINGLDLFVGGTFTNIGGQARLGVAKLSALGTGSADPLWNPGIQSIVPFASGVAALALDGENLFVGGDFNGIGGNPGILNLARVSSVGSGTVAGWSPNPNGAVTALAVTNGSVYVAGADLFNIAGQPQPHLAKFNASGAGALDPDWDPVPAFGDGANLLGTLVATESSVIAAGNFHTIDGAVVLGLVRLDQLTGLADPAFPAQVQAPGKVAAIVRQSDDRLILGGDFWFAGGLPRRNLARVNRDGTLDIPWAPEVDNTVAAMALQGDDLFIGGMFRKIGDMTRHFAAKISTLGTDAMVDPLWNPGPASPASFHQVRALALDGTNLFLGGFFSEFGGTNRESLAKISTTGAGAADPLWRRDTFGVAALAVSGTNLFAGGGAFTVFSPGLSNLAKLSTLGVGAVDTNWFPNPQFNPGEGSPGIEALCTDGTNVFASGAFRFIGGQPRGSVAKLSAATGLADPLWNPSPTNNAFPFLPFVTSLALSDTHLYIGGGFAFGPSVRLGMARADRSGAGTLDPNWNPGQDNRAAFAFLITGNDVYVGGEFRSLGGPDHNSFGLLPQQDAPVVFQGTTNDLYIVRNPADGPAITHFRIQSVTGGTLFRNDGVTPINPGDFLTASEAGAGLKFNLGGSVTVAPALRPIPEAVGTNTTTFTMSTNFVPVFALSSENYSTREGDGSVVLTVRKFGAVAAQVDYATTPLTATGGLDYLDRTGRLSFAASDTAKTVIIPIGDDFLAEGDETFQFALSLVTNFPNALIVTPGRAFVTLRDNDVAAPDSFATNQNPALPPVANGTLVVNLEPPAALGQWRLLGEMNWRDSGAQVDGLVSANYAIEFRPVTGYRQPERLTVPINGGTPGEKFTNQLTLFYAATTNTEAGALAVTLKPDNVATNANVNLRGQWRRQGTTNWLNSGEVVPGLNAGNYTVEFKSVPGLTPPAPQLIEVGPNATYGSVGTYLLGELAGAQLPIVVSPALAASNAPYVHNGQIQSSVGFGSGFVVKERVVLTAAHVLFDDYTLSYVTDARWFHQRYRGQFEPPAQTPRGWYIFEGYAFQRQQDNSPGISTPASQNLDVAAMYFLEPAGRGGFGGYLAADPAASELLGGANKMLVGYPLEGVPEADQGKLHATPLTNLTFVRLYTGVFATTNILSSPGNSGGPLYVQTGPTNFFPAGVFLGGSGQTLVRGIDSDVVDLINRAETSGNGGGNSTGGGVTPIIPGITLQPFGTGLLTVNLGAAGSLGGGWRIAQDTDTNFITNATATVALISGGDYNLQFRPAPGLQAPSNRVIRVAINQTVVVDGAYLSPADTWRAVHFGGNANNPLIAGPGADPDGDGAVNLLEYALGTDPNSPSAGWLPSTGLTNILGTNYLLLRFTRVTNNTDLTYTVLAGGSPTNYLTGSVYSATLSIGTNAHTTQLSRTGAPIETIIVRDNTPVGTATNRFMRLNISQP